MIAEGLALPVNTSSEALVLLGQTDTKPLSQPMLVYCIYYLWNSSFMQLESQYSNKTSLMVKWIWLYRVQIRYRLSWPQCVNGDIDALCTMNNARTKNTQDILVNRFVSPGNAIDIKIFLMQNSLCVASGRYLWSHIRGAITGSCPAWLKE